MKQINCDILGLCCPRSGSRSSTLYFESIGLKIGHETLKANGIVSWWLSYNKSKNRKYKCSGLETLIIPNNVIRILRNPLDCISSLVLENEYNHRNNNSFRYRSFVISRVYNINIDMMDATQAAIYSYIYWNEIIELYNHIDFNVRIEYIHKDILNFIEKNAIKANQFIENKSINKFKSHPQKISHDNVLAALSNDQDCLNLYNKYMKFYV